MEISEEFGLKKMSPTDRNNRGRDANPLEAPLPRSPTMLSGVKLQRGGALLGAGASLCAADFQLRAFLLSGGVSLW